MDQKPTAEIRSRGRAGVANKQGQGTSEPGRADGPSPEEEAWVRGERGRSDPDRRARIRSTRLEFEPSDLGQTTEI